MRIMNMELTTMKETEKQIKIGGMYNYKKGKT